MVAVETSNCGNTVETWSIQEEDFNYFCGFLKTACGISLAPNKQYLVSTRLKRILDEHQVPTLKALVSEMETKANSGLRDRVIDAMTTNETYWFRDGYPFEYLQDELLPEWVDEGRKTIRIWSAACSSGQEPYSLAIACNNFLKQNPTRPIKVEIFATDLSQSMLDTAAEGVYDKFSMSRGMPEATLKTYFQEKEPGRLWQLNDSVRKLVKFRSVNLLDSYSLLGQFDIIYCRNVLIYFSRETKLDIMTRLHEALNPNGILCLGSSEGISGLNDRYQMLQCQPGIMYRKVNH